VRVLFVGATGAVGRLVVPLLADRFDLTLAGRTPADIGGLPFRAGDISRFEECETMVAGMDAIVNCAIARYARVSGDHPNPAIRQSPSEYDEDMIEVNVRGAYHLYEAAYQAGVRRVVYIGSMTVWMGDPRLDQVEANTPPQPRGLYGCTKLFGDILGRDYATSRGMQVLCLHIGQPYPLGMPQERNNLTSPHLRGVMVAIDDIAEAISCALTADTPRYGSYPIVSTSDAEWVDASIAEEIGWRSRWRFTQDGAERT
jgi:uronate dehydrogenase